MAIVIAAGIVGVVAMIGSSSSYDDYSCHSDYSDYAVRQARIRAEEEKKLRTLQTKKEELQSYVNNEIDSHVIDHNVNISIPKWSSYSANFENFNEDFIEQQNSLNRSLNSKKDKFKNNTIHHEIKKIDDILDKIDNILESNK